MTTSAQEVRASRIDHIRPDSLTLANSWDIAMFDAHQGHDGPPTCHPCSMVAFLPDEPRITEKACPRCGCIFDADLAVLTQGRRCPRFTAERRERLRTVRPAGNGTPNDHQPPPPPEPRREEHSMSFRVDGHCPGCGIAFDIFIKPIHVEDGAALSMVDAVAAGVVQDWPARHHQQQEPIQPIPIDEAVPLPADALEEPDQPAASPAQRAEDDHQTNRQEAKRQRAAAGKVCPVHHQAKPSRFGGLYCPRGDAEHSTGYCQWTSKAAKKEEAA